MVTTFDVDYFSPAFLENPHPYYARLRDEEPVYWSARYKAWVLTQYEDVVWVARHPELFSAEKQKRNAKPPYPPINEEDAGYLKFVKEFRFHEFIQNDPPDHTRMRGAIHHAFSPRVMERQRLLVRSIVRELLDRTADRGHMDIIADLAMPLPLLVISRLLGIPEEDRMVVRDLAVKRITDGLTAGRMQVSAAGIQETTAYLTPLIEQRLQEPTEDLLSLLAEAEKRGVYSREEVQANAQSLIDAGHETTMRLISYGTVNFLRHPDQWDLLRSDPAGLARGAVEECLRFHPPVPTLNRFATRDVSLRGRSLRAGDEVDAMIVAGNRDPSVFPDPDRFDITRSPNHHLAFGSGVHYCIGQYLARLEGQEVFMALAARFPSLRLGAGQVEYKQRGRQLLINTLPLVWD